MLIPFENVLSSTLTTVTLISGVGLVMLCMTNRYNHTLDRIRQLMKKFQDSDNSDEPDLLSEIYLIYWRSRLLRWAILCIALSALFSSLLIATTVIGSYMEISFSKLPFYLLCCSLSMIVSGITFFALEATTSLHALEMALKHLPIPLKAKSDQS